MTTATPARNAVPALGISVLLYPRRKRVDTSEPPYLRGRAPVSIRHENISPWFGSPLGEAASGLGISITTLEKACRQLGVTRWPYGRGSKIKKATPIKPANAPPALAPSSYYTNSLSGPGKSTVHGIREAMAPSLRSYEAHLSKQNTAIFTTQLFSLQASYLPTFQHQYAAQQNSQPESQDSSQYSSDDLSWLVANIAENFQTSSNEDDAVFTCFSNTVDSDLAWELPDDEIGPHVVNLDRRLGQPPCQQL